MKKSIFSRYFYLGTIITFFFAALLGSLVLLWADGRYEDEKREQAANMAHLMITETRENYSRYGRWGFPRRSPEKAPAGAAVWIPPRSTPSFPTML